jgi:hypothetical protein
MFLMPQVVQAPPIPPTPPAPTVGRVTFVGAGDGPAAVYRAQVAQRKELADQLEQLQDTRENLVEKVAEVAIAGAGSGSGRAGLEARIAAIDARIADVDKQIAAADAAVARAAGIPGAVVEDPPEIRNGPPEEVFVLGGMFIVVVFLPLSIAFARRIWRRGAVAVAALPQEVIDRLTRLDHAVDSIAVEVERIGEGQRFMTRVLAEKGGSSAAGLGPGAEQRVPR